MSNQHKNQWSKAVNHIAVIRNEILKACAAQSAWLQPWKYNYMKALVEGVEWATNGPPTDGRRNE